MTDIYKLIFLISCIGAGKPRLWELAQDFDCFEDMYNALVSDNASAYFTPAEITAARRTSDKHINAVTDYCSQHNITMLAYDDDRYPARLRRIINPPALLFCKGNADILNDEIILSVVGARNISSYTEKAEKHLTAALASNGVTIASGFAVGADILANLTAVRNGGRTIAVLGCGIDYSYPAENMRYVDEIISNGVIVSEYFPKASAQRLNFTARNRILAGLSSGIAVMEASEKSGSLNIAAHGINQGKDIWVMSVHDITEIRYNGGKELLRTGAMPIYGPEDILGMYFENTRVRPAKERASDYSVLTGKESEASASAPDERKPALPVPEKKIPDLNEEEKIVYDILSKSDSPLSADDIADTAGCESFRIFTVLTELELNGIVYSEDGQKYYLIQ